MMIQKIITNLDSEGVLVNPLAIEFLKYSQPHERFAVGRNKETLALHQFLPIAGIIEDGSGFGDNWNQIPLLRSENASNQSYIINCATSISPVSVIENLKKRGFEKLINFCDVVQVADGKLKPPKFLELFHEEIKENLLSWEKIFENLADEISKKTLIDIIKFRYTANPKYMRNYQVRVNEQYFEEFMEYEKEVFVDAGGYDGDTTEEFIKKYDDYMKVYFFEPSIRNLHDAKNRLSTFTRIEYFSQGLSNKKGFLKFNMNGGSASNITTDGEQVIEVDRLDDLIKEKVSFIKMDLEGWELKALEGALRHILSERPKLAIAVYHNAADFRLIFDFIFHLNLDYKIFLRHYTQGWSETIMYFKP